ncbi:MAG: HAMP domain-containing sensor histidine kinase [Sulfuricurvum sp.]|uniref:sensor histidine kinase n=1 Tax=Sulfuricurvum sp. TaxID=2025608 RepID=UPI00261AB883|nr:HAMP domain-containing sensor histidine kinase [Sulfuricurvum sp.]MDD2829409.1 HAMP domain-containing sensor histidine kinase [Sulfuricurvum sp.]MDD4948229.1 HAMP domain-containing sensor histidine kinase [Sulfuricurvum sp.]
MSATSASGINFAKYRTLKSFLILYGIMSVLILALLGLLYYQYAKAVMLSSQRLAMQLESESYVPKLKQWLENDRNLSTFPKDLAYTTALYGYDRKPIISRLNGSDINFKENIYVASGHIYLIVPLLPYGMGEYYLIFETEDDGLWRQQTLEITLTFGIILFLMLVGVGFLLSRLILRPMNEAIALLDDFIKDTTHELNTPVSAILTNLESLDRTQLSESVQKKLGRIEIASRTISTLYDDLTYLILNHDLIIHNEPLDISHLLGERIEYFRHRIEQKKITLKLSITGNVTLSSDRTKMTRVIDNLLSNAIKYNKMGGEILISLTPSTLCIQDNGIGIPKDMIDRVFERYTRADKSVGGFGIGLHIVAMIAKEYGMNITIESEQNQGTKICVEWR